MALYFGKKQEDIELDRGQDLDMLIDMFNISMVCAKIRRVAMPLYKTNMLSSSWNADMLAHIKNSIKTTYPHVCIGGKTAPYVIYDSDQLTQSA
jgi:hypothetical protein